MVPRYDILYVYPVKRWITNTNHLYTTMKFALFLACIGTAALFALKTIAGVAPVVQNHNATAEINLTNALGK